jgi:hypothetical protein
MVQVAVAVRIKPEELGEPADSTVSVGHTAKMVAVIVVERRAEMVHAGMAVEAQRRAVAQVVAAAAAIMAAVAAVRATILISESASPWAPEAVAVVVHRTLKKWQRICKTYKAEHQLATEASRSPGNDALAITLSCRCGARFRAYLILRGKSGHRSYIRGRIFV